MPSLEPLDGAPRSRAHSVRYRLLAIALLPMLVILPALLGLAIYRWNAKFDEALISKVHSDLTIAHQYLARILEDTGERLSAVTNSVRFQDALRSGNGSAGPLEDLLKETAETLGFDFLYIIADDGNIAASKYPIASGSLRRDWPAVASALDGRPKTVIDVFEASDLSTISAGLAEKARIKIVPTDENPSEGSTEETRGLVLQSASPVTLPSGRRAALVGGILLNHNLGFVDTINDLIYHGSGLPQGSVGTVTLFLDDVRISTNVRLFDAHRAIGTRVSAPVLRAVLGDGRTWLDSAFVVNDWYISGYEPIVGSNGRRVGMLYAGFLQKPFTETKRRTLIEIALAFLIAVGTTVPLFLRWAAAIFRPLEQMAQTIGRVEKGDLDARTRHADTRDEIGTVAAHLDRLLDQIDESDRKLRHWNEELNRRVEERTSTLARANQQLEATTRQLIMSEKLAAIGEISANIAHEINNPVAVMQGNLEVIREMMGREAEAAKTEFRLIDEQLHRISEIVTRLLQFAKPQEYAGDDDQYDVAAIIDDTLPLVAHLLAKTTITVEREYRASRLVAMNRTELQQVLVNLSVNAIHAMPDGGRLIFRTFDGDENGRHGVVIEIADTGHGMAPDVSQRIFDPFFTTKRRGGTGLGLSISQMLVARQRGRINVESEAGRGTRFAIWLPESV